ncbi:MAG: N-acetyltransferase [Clostridia bacterium]|nr:N-acetyltransferase [Clostridia bacterium]
MSDVYTSVPTFESGKYILRYVTLADCSDLLEVYSDINAVPFFNSDNCGGDDFHYTTTERMIQAINYWHWEYSRKGFVRWSVIDKSINKAVGTIELFHRDADDHFSNCGLLRLDLKSAYEKSDEIEDILSLIIQPTFSLFDCDKIATKAISSATERINALKKSGFEFSDEKLIGHDGTEYCDYYVLRI